MPTTAPQSFDELIEHVATLSYDANKPEGLEAYEAGLLGAIAACETADQLRRLLMAGDMEDALFGEDEFWPSVANALMAWAERAVEPNDAAQALGILVRCTAFDEEPQLSSSIEETVKDEFLSAVGAHADVFRAGLRAPHPALRAAHAHALACCRTATAEDAAELIDLARTEAEDEPLATFLLAFGEVIRRRRAAGLDVPSVPVDLLTARLDHASTLVRTCAAAALALVGERLAERAVAVLTESIESPAPVPAAWGWIGARPGTTEDIAILILIWAPVDAPTSVIRALTRYPGGGIIADALLHLAFEDGKAIPPLGLVLDELSGDQRLALAAFEKEESEWDFLYRFGFGQPSDVTAFLEGEAPGWKPIPIASPSGPRHWHFWRIYRGRVWEELTEVTAATAILDGLPPESIIETVCPDARGVRLQWEGRSRDAACEERDQQLAAELVRGAIRHGFDPRPMLERMAGSRSDFGPPAGWDYVTVTTCLLAAHAVYGTHPPEGVDEVVAIGVQRARSEEPIASLLAGLPTERRATLRAPTRSA